MNYEKLFRYDGKKGLLLNDWKTKFGSDFESKEKAVTEVKDDIAILASLQDKLYAQSRHAVLILFQAMDAAGKDSTIKHVMSGINPQGCQVYSFKTPTTEELAHDYLWRIHKCVPARGRIGIFNRSYYEDVLVTKVHPSLILNEALPGIQKESDIHKRFWKERYEDITHFENYLSRNGTTIIKFFLHLSKEEQNARFSERIDQQEKNWKFSANDMKERAFWDQYQGVFEDAIQNTSTKGNPWYIVPADAKWFLHLAVSKIIIQRLDKLNLAYPTVSKESLKVLDAAKKELQAEK